MQTVDYSFYSSQSEKTQAELTEQMKLEQEAKQRLEENLQLIKSKMQQVLEDKELAEQK